MKGGKGEKAGAFLSLSPASQRLEVFKKVVDSAAISTETR